MTLPGILPFSDDQSEKVVTIQFYRDPKLGGLDEHQARDQLGIEEESSEEEEDEDAEELKKQQAQVGTIPAAPFVNATYFSGKVGLGEEQAGEEKGRKGVDGYPHKGEENGRCGGIHQERAKQSRE